jgi:membrane protein
MAGCEPPAASGPPSIVPPVQWIRAWWRRRAAPTAAWGAATRFQSDNMGDHAAALSYYGALAIFPALLVGLTILGLVGEDGLVSELVSFSRDHGADAATTKVVESVARGATETSSQALGLALLVSLFFAINAASGIWGAAGRAINVAHGVPEKRGFLRRRLIVLALTLVAIAFFLLSVSAVFLGDEWARSLFGKIGVGAVAVDVWDIVRWPVALLFALAALAVVVRYAPDPEARRSRALTTGSVVTVVLWVLATLGFSFYVGNFGRYGAVYGTFATLVVLLLWLYLMALAFLYGAELDAELARRGAARRAAAAQN